MKKILSTISLLMLSAIIIATSIPCTMAAKKPKAPTGMKITGYEFLNNSIQIEFPTIQNVTGYEIKAYNNKNACVSTKEYKSHSELKKQTIYATKVKYNNFYKIIVRSYIKVKNKKTYSNKSKAIYGCLGTKISQYAYSTKTKKHTFRWAKTNGATNYIVQISTNKDVWYKVASTKSTSCSFAKVNGKALNRGQLYDVRVVAQKKVGSKVYNSYGKVYNFYSTHNQTKLQEA